MCQILSGTGTQGRTQHSSCHSQWPGGTNRQALSLSTGERELRQGGLRDLGEAGKASPRRGLLSWDLKEKNMIEFLKKSFLRSFG